MVVFKIPISAFVKSVFYTPEICRNILNKFWGGIKTNKVLYKRNWYTWRFIILLEIVICGRLCLVSVIYDIGFVEYNYCVMWYMLNGESGI